MDSIDAKILEVLQQNCRISLSDLSKRVNLSVSAVSERIKKLDNSGIVEEYTAIINPRAMRKDLAVLMQVSIDVTHDESRFFKLVAENEDILECHHVTGEYDYVLKIITEDTSTLESLMSKVKSIPGVRGTQTNVFLSTLKNRHSVAPVANK